MEYASEEARNRLLPETPKCRGVERAVRKGLEFEDTQENQHLILLLPCKEKQITFDILPYPGVGVTYR